MPKNLKQRGSVLLMGVALMAYGYSELRAGHFSYLNRYRMVVFSDGVIAIGATLVLLSFVPDRFVEWIARKSRRSHPFPRE